MQYAIELQQLASLEAAWQQAPAMVERELHGFFAGAVAHLEGEVIERAPAAHGLLRASMFGEYRVNDGEGIGVVASASPYAVPVELGTRPHMPPVQPLVDWAMTKLGLDADEARQAGFRIARAIARRGTKGQFMFRDAFAANEAQVIAQFNATVDRIVAQLLPG